MAASDSFPLASQQTSVPSGSEQPTAAPKGTSALSIENSHTCIRPDCDAPADVCLACYSVEAGIADRLEALEARLAKVTAQRDHEAQQRLLAERDVAVGQGRAATLEHQLLEAKAVREYHRRMWARLASVLGRNPKAKPEELVQLARFESLLETSVQRWVAEEA